MGDQPIRAPAHPEVAWLGGFGVIFRLAGEVTDGRFAVMELPVKPGALIPPHTHSREDEFGLVLEGTLGARVGDGYIEAGAGDWLIRPRGVPHAFWNPGPTEARLLEIVSPAGFERYFAELIELQLGGVGPFDPAWQAVRTKYGVTGKPDWVDELERRFGVRLRP